MASSSSSLSKKKDQKENLLTEDDAEKFKYLEKYFKLTRIEAGEKRRNLIFTCESCKPKVTSISAQENSLSNLLRHFKNVHPTIQSSFENVYYLKNLRKRANESDETGSKQQKITTTGNIFFRSNCTQERFNEVFVEHLTESMSPFTLGQQESFRKMIRCVDPNKSVPTYRTVVKYVDKEFENMMKNLHEDLAKALSVAIATDGWKGTNHKNFAAYTATWLDKDLIRKFAVLAVRRFTGRHGFEEVRKECVSILKEFK